MGLSLSVLREGGETECYFPGRGERRTITTQGGVGGGCNNKHYWFNWFFIIYPMPLQQDKTFC